MNEKDLWTGIFTAAIPAGNRRSRFGSKGEEQSDPVSRVCMQGPCGVHVGLVCARLYLTVRRLHLTFMGLHVSTILWFLSTINKLFCSTIDGLGNIVAPLL